MKIQINKVSAFTLIEVIMVMVLSLLVLGVVLLGFRNFQQYSTMQEKESKRIEDVLLVQAALNSWFFKAKEIHYVNDAILFKDSLIFGICKFDKEVLILESQGISDSYKITPVKLRVLKAKQIPYVTELYFEIAGKGVQNPYLFRKEYGKAVLFNANK